MVYFSPATQSVESGKVVLDGGYVDLDPVKLAGMATATAHTSVGGPLHVYLCTALNIVIFLAYCTIKLVTRRNTHTIISILRVLILMFCAKPSVQ